MRFALTLAIVLVGIFSTERGRADEEPDNLFVANVVTQTTQGLAIINRTMRGAPPNCDLENGFMFDGPAALEAYRRARQFQLREEISEADANKIFEEMRASQDLPFRYPEDGCYARAHQMSRMLELRGYNSKKMFLEGDLRTPSTCAEADPRKKTARGQLKFWFHVAPTIMVRKSDGSLIKMVMDPALFQSPVPYQAWQEKLTAEQRKNNPKYSCTPISPLALASRKPGLFSRDCRFYESPRFRYNPVLDRSELEPSTGPGNPAKIREKTSWDESDLSESNYTLYSYAKIDTQRKQSNPQCNPGQ